VRYVHLLLTKVAVKTGIYAKAFYTTVIYSSDLFTYNAEYRETLSGEKWPPFANSLRIMLKLSFTLHEVAWQFHNLAYRSRLMFGRIIATIALGHYSVQIGHRREHNYTEIVLKHVFLNNFFTFCAIGLIDNSCM